jgi:hypothetical protein
MNTKKFKQVRRTDPKLWERVKKKITHDSKGGKPGQWSARKAQLTVAEYKKRGGEYTKKSPKPRDTSLGKWTRQEWGTKSGKNSVVGKKATGERYLPKKARDALTDKEYKQTSRKKRRDMKKGVQYSRQPSKISRKSMKSMKSTRTFKMKSDKKYTVTDTKNKTVLKSIKKSDRANKKYKATFTIHKDGKKKEKTTYFGYPSPTDPNNDYTRHKDKTRRNRYIWRHMKDTRTGDPTRAGYLSLYVLWNKPSLKASITDYKKRLGKYNRTGTFPLDISGYQKPANAKTKIQRSK